MTDLLDSILDAKAAPPETSSHRLSAEEFIALTAKIDFYRERIISGERLARDEVRDIVVWFRERRKTAFTLVEEKPKKERKTATPRKATTRKKLSAEEQQALSDAILNSL